LRGSQPAAGELRVLQAVANGATKREAGDETGIVLGTVRWCLSRERLYARLGARHLAHAVAIALREGLIE
jgi:DNA-binding NarL/FixJ family response regulator